MLLKYFSSVYFCIISIVAGHISAAMAYVRGLFLFLCLSNIFIIICFQANAEKGADIANINAYLNINNINDLKNKNRESVKNIKIVADLRPIYFLVKDLIEGTLAELILIEEGEEALHGHGFALKPNEISFIQKADLLVTYNDYKGENYKIAENKVILLNKPCLLAWLPLRNLISKATPIKEANIQVAIENYNNNHGHGHFHASSPNHTYEKLNHEPSSGHNNKHSKYSTSSNSNSNSNSNSRKDVHFWLDPQNALKTIEITNQKLKELDPFNAEIYQNNYEKLRSKINAEIILIKKQLRLLTSKDSDQEESGKEKYLVLHDAYQYFEKFFEIISPIGYFYDNNHNIVSFQTMNDYLNMIKNIMNNSKAAKGKEPLRLLSCIISNRKKDKLLESFNGQAKIKIIYLEPTGHDINIKSPENGYILLLRNMSSGFQQCFSQY